MNYEYLFTLILVLIVSIVVHYRYEVTLFRKRATTILMFLIFIIIGMLWDTIGVERGFWTYPKENNVGIIVLGLPIEEFLFYIIIPYFVLVVYRVLTSNKKRK